MMNVKEVLEKNKEDSQEIEVIIQDSQEKTFLGDAKEVYEGPLAEVPARLYERSVLKISQICDSSVPERVGANVLIVE